ncbi:MAG TPA: N-acetyl-gamma-glutamyl-phosphate reductase [Anaerolineae bacterium]|nr:N-acetyl-gamma-glutamyl-phosphate reductase [Anaerolineae bacterium]HIQ05613.1 N-acetyl-gamma-glutamyl-phosphate reductase [Anaerolineae bacterium]
MAGESTVRVGIVGGSGYVGGELLRLLLDHPHVQVAQVTSERNAGRFVHTLHPNLRGRTRLKFVSQAELAPCDLLFLALPHGQAQRRIREFAGLAERIVDLSADFRLHDPKTYERWYSQPHAAPDWLDRFVYGLPEVNQEHIVGARYVSGVGCNATAVNLAIWPLFRAGLADPERDLVAEVKVGSSEGGNQPSSASHHPERSGVVRSFAPVGHRHTAEVAQLLATTGAVPPLHLSVTAVELVRGALATAHVFLADRSARERDLWRAYREAYSSEPFVRIVKDRQGIYRYPEPKILTGSNYADVGFALEETSGRVVAIAAIDNLMKGAAGTAVQCMNLMYGWDETLGLTFPGLHPV